MADGTQGENLNRHIDQKPVRKRKMRQEADDEWKKQGGQPYGLYFGTDHSRAAYTLTRSVLAAGFPKWLPVLVYKVFIGRWAWGRIGARRRHIVG